MLRSLVGSEMCIRDSTMCIGVLCYTLHSTWHSLVCVPLTSSTCSVCIFAVCYGCTSLLPERVELCVPVYVATHCIVHGIHWYVYRFLRGTSSVCTFAVWYGCASLWPDCVVICAPVYGATHCIVHGIRGYVFHLLRDTFYVCTFAVCYGYASLCLDGSYYVHRYTVVPIA